MNYSTKIGFELIILGVRSDVLAKMGKKNEKTLCICLHLIRGLFVRMAHALTHTLSVEVLASVIFNTRAIFAFAFSPYR